ncbi:hypothetical protein ARMGADRAFT_1068409 [Armillaria gallica]|uniref:Uncharacterized protein n=1 Tax=Armillaria gallica TaxID=47427 RepID=A0A2H3CKD3_ARMGA|nr:hypothetical protein ARMGADRAFT_1068409 [Armillaria gallica]
MLDYGILREVLPAPVKHAIHRVRTIWRTQGNLQGIIYSYTCPSIFLTPRRIPRKGKESPSSKSGDLEVLTFHESPVSIPLSSEDTRWVTLSAIAVANVAFKNRKRLLLASFVDTCQASCLMKSRTPSPRHLLAGMLSSINTHVVRVQNEGTNDW